MWGPRPPYIGFPPTPPQVNAVRLVEGATTTPSLSSKHPKRSDTRSDNPQREHQQSLRKCTPMPGWVRDKGLAEIAKKVCVVNADDYSYFRSVRGDSVTQTLVGYKNLKTSLLSDVFVGRAFHGEFWYNIPRKIRQTSPQTTTGTHPTCPHGTHSQNSSSSTIS